MKQSYGEYIRDENGIDHFHEIESKTGYYVIRIDYDTGETDGTIIIFPDNESAEKYAKCFCFCYMIKYVVV